MNITAIVALVALPRSSSEDTDDKKKWLLLLLGLLFGLGFLVWKLLQSPRRRYVVLDEPMIEAPSKHEVEAKISAVRSELDAQREEAEAGKDAKEAAAKAHRQALNDLSNAEREAQKRYARALQLAMEQFRSDSADEDTRQEAAIHHKEAQRAAATKLNREVCWGLGPPRNPCCTSAAANLCCC